MSRPQLVLRAAAGPGQGAGHVARAFALGEAWRDHGGDAVLVSEPLPGLWVDRCARAGIELADLNAPPDGTDAPGWAVLDGYRFGLEDQRAWRALAGRLLVVDDHAAAGTWEADLVLDQNLGASAPAYRTGPDRPELLLGPRYALLRREFGDRAGSDDERHRPGVVRPVPVGRPRVALAAGGGPRAEVAAWFDQLARELDRAGLDVVRLDGVEEVADALADVEVVVSAAGGSAWELGVLGMACVLVALSANQVPVAARLDEAGAARAVLGGGSAAHPGAGAADPALPPVADVVTAVRQLVADPDARQDLGTRARAIVDGQGARRVATRMRADLLEVRRVEAGDARLLWAWANDPVTRAQSFSPSPISWESHLAWFEGRLADPRGVLWLAADPDGMVGHVRLAPLPDGAEGHRPGEVEIGVVVAPERRGQHLAGPLIDAAVRRSAHELDQSRVQARIKPDNQPSRRAFVAADFDLAPDQPGRARGWLRYTRQLHGSDR